MNTLIKFSSKTCAPCKELDKVISDTPLGCILYKSINYEDEPQTFKEYNIRTVPTLVITNEEGREIMRSAGVLTSSELQRFVGYVPPWKQTW